ncbi:hypothetical protein AAKU67_001064 [Oxalobacteraceae bacterium GrIS 2.11]
MFGLFTRRESIPCYHCGERVALRHVVTLKFDGALRDLCCHGCEAVLMMVESHGLTDEYVQNKNSTALLTP